MTSIIFYGGVEEIGGNKILVEDKGTKIFLDFGKSFDKERKIFDDPYIIARKEADLIEFGILPNIKGMYKKDDGECDIDGIIVSHAHTDHYEYIRFVKDNCPIYCGETTANIIMSRDFIGNSIGEDYSISKLTSGEVKIYKDFMAFRTGNIIKDLSPIEIMPTHVDHSIPGSYGFNIETTEGRIVYTGDFRMHGPRADLTLDFIKNAKEFEPDILIIEGTHVDFARHESENEVKFKVESVVKGSNGLVICVCGGSDIDRLRTFYEVAVSRGRKLAIPMRQAFYIHMLRKDPHLNIFRLDDPNICIYKKDKKTIKAYERLILDEYANNVIDAKIVQKYHKNYILFASLYDMREMTEIKPIPDSIYILSYTEPFNEELEIQQDKLLNWLNHYGIPVYHIHASGHANPQEIKKVIRDIKPKKVFPIHTKYPEFFQKYMADLRNEGIEIILPKLGESKII